MLYVLAWLLFPFIAAAIAHSKDRSAVAWFFIGLLIGPLSLIVIFESRGGYSCPACRKPIDIRATICPYCRSPIIEPEPGNTGIATIIGAIALGALLAFAVWRAFH